MPREWRAPKVIKQSAKELRHNSTKSERRLWAAIRRRQIVGVRFRRQHPIGRYIADFCSVENRLIIEVDGAAHNFTDEKDQARQAWLEANGYRVIRFTNDEVMNYTDNVVELIRRTIKDIAS